MQSGVRCLPRLSWTASSSSRAADWTRRTLALVEEVNRGGGGGVSPQQQGGNERYQTVNAVRVFETFTTNRLMLEDKVICSCLCS